MGVAALVLGIISFIIALIPLCGMVAFVPAIIGLVLGIVHISKKNKEGEGENKGKGKGIGIAGVVLNALALIFIIFYTIIIGAALPSLAEEVGEALNNIDFNTIESEYYNGQ